MIILIVNLKIWFILLNVRNALSSTLERQNASYTNALVNIARSIQNHHQLTKPTPVSAHFNQPGHSINHLLLTPLELIHSKRDSVRKAREAHLINKAMTLEPLGINRRDVQN